MTLFMIGISAFGAYSQIPTFTSYFIKELARAKKSAAIFLALFYIGAIINLGLLGTIDINTKYFKSSQQKIEKLNHKVHDFDSRIRSY